MSKIGIITPVGREFAPYLKILKEPILSKKSMLAFTEGKIENVDVVMVQCGVCKVNAAIATQILIEQYGVSFVIVSGTAGGMDRRLEIGDTVISTEIVYHDVVPEIIIEGHPCMQSEFFYGDENMLGLCRELIEEQEFTQNIFFGRIATGETFIDKEGRASINERYSPLCVDMETAAIGHVCYVNSVPFIAVRSISDNEEKSGVDSFKLNCDKAAENSADIVHKLILNIPQNTKGGA